jgi:hypothetical protein
MGIGSIRSRSSRAPGVWVKDVDKTSAGRSNVFSIRCRGLEKNHLSCHELSLEETLQLQD